MTRYSIDGQPVREAKWESWGFFRLSAAIIAAAVVVVLIMDSLG